MTAKLACTESADPSVTLWCGAYTSVSGGTATGIGRLELASEWSRSAVAMELESPSFIALHPSLNVLYAVSESAGLVHAFSMSGAGRLNVLGSGRPTGQDPCHVAVDPLGLSLVVSSWGDGSVDIYSLDAEGALVSQTRAVGVTTRGPALRRSRAHCALFVSGSRVVSTDLGHDVLRVWQRTGEGLALDHEVVFPIGCGPRHVALHPDGKLLVVTEFTGQVFLLVDIDGHLVIQDSVSSTTRPNNGGLAAAHVVVNDEGTRAYITLRKLHSVSTVAIEQDDNSLRLLAETPSGGEWPRHHALHTGRLLVANEHSGDITVLSLDPEGLPLPARTCVRTPSPTCVVVG